MNVHVVKFDRNYEESNVVVGFYVRHPTYDVGMYVDFLVPMAGTDNDMRKAAWDGVLPRVTQWANEITTRRENGVVGFTFTVPLD